MTHCMDCGRPLSPADDWICAGCMVKRIDDWPESSDAELARREVNIERGYRLLAELIAGVPERQAN